jgi:hypothetical protein
MLMTLKGNAPAGNLMRNPSSALDLTELYKMPIMNLQPNYFHSSPANNHAAASSQNMPAAATAAAFSNPGTCKTGQG